MIRMFLGLSCGKVVGTVHILELPFRSLEEDRLFPDLRAYYLQSLSYGGS